MLEEDSDKYFLLFVRPLIRKAELTRILKPLGLAVRGKGSVNRKQKYVELLVDRLEGRGLTMRVVFSGSHYTSGDGKWNLFYQHPQGWTDEDTDRFTGDPKRDAGTILKAFKELMENMLSYEKMK
jgi:hypothetical protein